MKEFFDIEAQKKIILILKILQNRGKPLGSKDIAKEIIFYGVFISERTVRYYLKICDELGFTKKIAKIGRTITEKGKDEISNSFVIQRVGKLSSKINALSYNMDFNIKKLMGTIILNTSLIKKKDFYKYLPEIKNVFDNNISMGKYVFMTDEINHYPEFDNLDVKVKDIVLLGTVCSITLNGIFMKYKIYVESVFGGLLEMRNWVPYRFTEIIYYDGTSIDPIEIFLNGKMTTINEYLSTGNGKITASFREVPAVAYYEVLRIKKILEKIGLNGILAIGKPGVPLCDIPVSDGMIGFIVVGGLNPLATLIEENVEINNHALHTLFDFNNLQKYTEIK